MAKRKAKSEGSIIDPSRYEYKRLAVRGKDGKIKYSAGNGDAVAKAMLLHTAAGGTIGGIIRDNGLTAKFKDRDGGNAGTLRMSVGVALRALVRADTPVKIGSITVKTLKQHVDLPKIEKSAPGKPAGRKRKAKAVKRARKPAQEEAVAA